MEDSGVAKVCTALAHSAPYLEELDLSINEITKAGAQSVARCIIGKPGIVKLNLRCAAPSAERSRALSMSREAGPVAAGA